MHYGLIYNVDTIYCLYTEKNISPHKFKKWHPNLKLMM
ncbi:hypothetical protein SAMN05443429_1092 [Cruoricaptor ignavus]|uniref:Uncharacterized protein n=1 Tax=Cruoricaptor ignavus TaxID=1118202 RepID=A0A1M6GGF4_9FLAO|nr:hypothetical protein SAMN05443429_1092 [Cruoricaptor ignavus]